ncbi:MAG: Type 1 glutamine amidotransferase-like domain-containing protein [Deltaproteobacteria bacterium]|nr:Type 1 glutamine amidotransferase-like domain-containing protein [Deltaproteobacteria bacterium]
METPLKPILLLADSQLLFWRQEEELFLARLREMLVGQQPKAAYVGASNGDQPEFYQLFQGAMSGVGIDQCRMIPTEPTEADLAFLDQADWILLAGGDPMLGWKSFLRNGLHQKIPERYYSGALLTGVSAGAMQLGLHGIEEAGEQPGGLFETFKLVPYLIDVHSEPSWRRLRAAMPQAGEHLCGLGIPSGGGALVHPDLSVEPIRHPLTEVRFANDRVSQALIFPPRAGEESLLAEAPSDTEAVN